MKVVGDITGLVGETPMVRLNKVTKPGSAEVYAKLEWYNIGAPSRIEWPYTWLNTRRPLENLQGIKRS